MPALPLVPFTLRFDLIQSFGGDTNILNRFFLKYTGSVSVTDLTTLLGTVNTSYGTNFKGQMSVNHQLVSIRGTDLNSNIGAQVLIASGTAGTQAGTDMPPGVALVLEGKIARRYRGGHPRFYICSQQVARLLTPRTWSAATVSGVPAQWQAFINGCIAAPPAAIGTLSWVSVTYFSGFHVVTNPITGRSRNVPTLRGTPLTDAILSVTCNPIVASQRRRNKQSP